MQGETTPSAAKTETISQPQAHRHHYTSVLFHHEPHQHQPRNVNLLHEAEQAAAGINTRIAVGLTKSVGTMWTAYTFVVLAIIGLFAILGLLSPIVALLVAWTSQTLIQLVLLPIIMVGQNVQSRHLEIQAEVDHKTLGYIRTINDTQLQILRQLQATEDPHPLPDAAALGSHNP